MEIGSREWQNLIIDSARQLGIAVDERICAAFATHATELIRWNLKMNLTAITDPHDIAIHHFLDALTPAKFIPDRARLLDIGSGSGFPGIPLKIVKPSISILLIDGVRKKVNFLKHVLRILNLENVDARQIRAENLVKEPAHLKSFDVIISRSLSDLKSFVGYARPLLAQNGKIIAMKGEVNQKKWDALSAIAAEKRCVFKIENYKLPSLRAQRSLIILKLHH